MLKLFLSPPSLICNSLSSHKYILPQSSGDVDPEAYPELKIPRIHPKLPILWKFRKYHNDNAGKKLHSEIMNIEEKRLFDIYEISRNDPESLTFDLERYFLIRGKFIFRMSEVERINSHLRPFFKKYPKMRLVILLRNTKL